MASTSAGTAPAAAATAMRHPHPYQQQQSSSTPATPLTPSNNMPSPKKVKRKTSKPILTWISRRLGSTGRKTIPPPLPTGAQGTLSAPHAKGGSSQGNATTAATPTKAKAGKATTTTTPATTPTSAAPTTRGRKVSALRVIPPTLLAKMPENTIILNDSSTENFHPPSIQSTSSPGPGSTWSPSNPPEADDDASIRPLPPTSPPSPTPSRSSSSYLSDPRTFRSGAASTKPTTLLSFDSGAGGYGGGGGLGGPMAHIAQVSGASTSAAALVANFNPRSHSPSHTHSRTSSSLNPPPRTAVLHTYTTHHPRNNPHPASPPQDNASILTLASSAFAVHSPSGGSMGGSRHVGSGSTDWASIDGGSILNGSRMSTVSGAYSRRERGDFDVSSSRLDVNDVGDDAGEGEEGTLEGGEEGDAEASVRALRPRSSRRGSWESGESRWSARVPGGALVGGNGTAPSSLANVSFVSAVGRSGSWSRGGTSDIVRGASQSRPRSGLAVEVAEPPADEPSSPGAAGVSPVEGGGKDVTGGVDIVDQPAAAADKSSSSPDTAGPMEKITIIPPLESAPSTTSVSFASLPSSSNASASALVAETEALTPPANPPTALPTIAIEQPTNATNTPQKQLPSKLSVEVDGPVETRTSVSEDTGVDLERQETRTK